MTMELNAQRDDHIDDFLVEEEITEDTSTIIDDDSKKYPRINSLAGFLTENGPESVDLKKLPPAPLHIFSPVVQRMITEIAEAKNVPTEAPLCVILALVSALLGRSRGVIYRKEWREFANLYFLLIAETGAGKSHVIDYIFKDVSRIEAEKKRKYRVLFLEYLEKETKAKKDKSADIPQKPRDTQYLLDDATIEAAVGALEDNPKGLFWLIDEFAGFFAGLERYNKSGGDDGKRKLLSAFDGKTIRVNRRPKDGIPQNGYHSRATFGMLGGIQPHLLRKAFSIDDVQQGWPQRFLYCRAVIDKPMRLPAPEISHETERLICTITERLIDLEMCADSEGKNAAVYLSLDPDAVGEFENFSNMMQNRAFGTESIGYTSKMSRMLLRLALILHFLEAAAQPDFDPARETMVSYDAMLNAITLLAWLANHTEAARQYFPTLTATEAKKSLNNERKSNTRARFAEFITSSQEFCSEPHTAGEILKEMGGGWEWKGPNATKGFGIFLKNQGFESDGARYAKYTLYPTPENFAAKA